MTAVQLGSVAIRGNLRPNETLKCPSHKAPVPYDMLATVQGLWSMQEFPQGRCKRF